MAFLQDSSFSLSEVSDEELAARAHGTFIIALDFDGVISSPYTLKARYINEKGYQVAPEESSRERCLSLGISLEDYEEASIRAYTEDPSRLPLEPSCSESLAQLRTLPGCCIIIVTSRHTFMMDHLEQYLRHYKIRVDGVVNTSQKSKSDFVNRFSPSVLVDDTLSKLVSAMKGARPTTLCLLYQNISNRYEKTLPAPIQGVEGWDSLTRLITRHHKLIKGSN